MSDQVEASTRNLKGRSAATPASEHESVNQLPAAVNEPVDYSLAALGDLAPPLARIDSLRRLLGNRLELPASAFSKLLNLFLFALAGHLARLYQLFQTSFLVRGSAPSSVIRTV